MKAGSVPTHSLQRAARFFQLGHEPSDFTYWQSQSASDRLAALETIRCEYHGWGDETRPQFQRVHSILKR